jgi:sugar lactone lactonase YvrE
VFSASGGFLRKWGSNGGGNGQFAVAEDVNIASDGTVWVADQQNSRLQAFSPTGAFKLSIGFTSELPRGVGVDADGNVLAAVEGSSKGGFRRFDPAGTPIGALLGGGSYRVDDVEVSPDGTVYLTTAATQSSDDRIRRFTADGKPLGTIKLANGDGTRGIGVDLDCNVWASDTAGRQIVKHSPSGKRLATASVPDLVANDVAVGPKGDLYVIHQNTGIVRFAEDRSKPGTAIATVSLAKRAARAVARVKYTLAGVACPAQVDATASLSGAGVSGSAKVKVGAGKTTVIEIPLAKSPKRGASATFKIVLRTNGRPTTQTAAVRLG